jgi:hypothetical protein
VNIGNVGTKMRNGEYLDQSDCLVISQYVKQKFPMVQSMVAGRVEKYNASTPEQRKEQAKAVLKFIGG